MPAKHFLDRLVMPANHDETIGCQLLERVRADAPIPVRRVGLEIDQFLVRDLVPSDEIVRRSTSI